MKGLELSRRFYLANRVELMALLPDVMRLCAFGLAGEGSECFGMDDAASRDHDYGAAFCIWLPEADLRAHAPELENALAKLPPSFMGLPSRMTSEARMGRVGPIAIERFFKFFTGLSRPPSTDREWLAIPEYQLAAATNGAIFEDFAGKFTAWRDCLLAGFPTDVRLWKIASRCMIMAQSGQYNLPRALRRGDGPSAMLAAARFAEAALSLVFLFNGRYMPFYKWAPKMAERLPLFGAEVYGLLRALAAHPLRGPEDLGAAGLVEDFCGACAAHLRKEGLSSEPDSWLWAHGPQIAGRIASRDLRRLDLLRDPARHA